MVKSSLPYTHNHQTQTQQYADNNDATAFRKAVNGGTNGLKEFNQYLAKAKQCIKS